MGEQIVIGLIVAGAFAYAAKRLLLDPLRRRRAGGCGGGCGCSHAGAATAPAPTP
ncbi:MAG: FeoB-associated Cys-rich membrane protein, partial [Planctomycetes bacterium]|nr:FeoB-associated Cys-rich membrane protein [Planctomycetota bacterium]